MFAPTASSAAYVAPRPCATRIGCVYSRGMTKPRETRDKQYPLRLTDAERKTLEDAAKAAGMALSTWIRATCLAAAKKQKKKEG